MNRKERDRLRLVHDYEEGRITGKEASQILGISSRQFKRIAKRHREEGDRGLMHALRGKPSNRKLPEDTREEVKGHIRESYSDFGPTLAAEMLLKRHRISLSEETVRKIMIEEGLWKPRRKKEVHRKRRERKLCFGEMLQIDGSHHDWFEGRSDRCCLMVMVDDATNETRAMFFPKEDTFAGMSSLKGWILEFGVPRSIYADRHAIWIAQMGDKSERWEVKTTQLARALKELSIDFIAARSPQAKGRVERVNGILQDRLVKEMRLAKVSSIEEGNRFLKDAFLPEYNRKFRKKASQKADVHRKLSRDLKLSHILSERHERTVQNDYTVKWDGRVIQIGKPAYPGLRGGKAQIAFWLDGSLHLTFRGKELNWQEIISSTDKSIARHTAPGGSMGKGDPPPKPKSSWPPPPDHPWKKFRLRPPR